MAQPLQLRAGSIVVELGAGTGAITATLLKLLPRDARLFVFETNPRFYRYLTSRVRDNRLVALNVTAEALDQEMHRYECGAIDAAVSSLGLGYMSGLQRAEILCQVSRLLREDGVFTHFQYLHGLQFREDRLVRFEVTDLLRRYFGSVDRSIVWLNIPPAFVFACRKKH
jgi:phospholipid N-methyltransferase